MAASLHESCMDAIVAAIETLPLSGGAATRVYKQKLPVPADVQYPCVFVTLKGCKPDLHPFSTEEDEKVLPVAVHLMDREDVMDETTLSPWLLWLEQLPKPFLSQVLGDAVGSNWRIDLQMMDSLDAQASAGPAYQNAVSSFFVRCSCVTPSATSP